jgi:hypothetical protein
MGRAIEQQLGKRRPCAGSSPLPPPFAHRSSFVICSCVSASDPMASIRVKGKKRLRRRVAL